MLRCNPVQPQPATRTRRLLYSCRRAAPARSAAAGANVHSWATLAKSYVERHGQGRTFAVQPFTREERIFTLYGVLTALYAVIAIVFAFQFWRRWLWGTITHLWACRAAG